MPTLDDVVTAALPLRLGTVFVSPDGVLAIRESPAPSAQRFVLDDLQYHVTLTPEDAGTRFRIWTELGYVPYTVRSPDRRRCILSILRATRRLERACFAVDHGQRILALGETVTAEPMTVDAMVYEILLFLQEARPFIRLIGRYL